MNEFQNRVAVVTGGASGIGRALARRLAEEGMKLVVADVDDSELQETVIELEAAGAEALGVLTDVSSPQAVEALADATWSRFGAVHVLCANAGVMQDVGPLWEKPIEDFNWVFGVNMWGPIHCVRSFLPRMLADGDRCFDRRVQVSQIV